MKGKGMESLNDIVRRHVERYGKTNPYLSSFGVEIEFDFDPDMPAIYPDWTSDDAPIYLSSMLAELTNEHTDLIVDRNIFTKLRYGTLFVDNTQVIIIDHNGKHIPYETLSVLNGKLDRVAETGHAPYGRGGNQRAASKIQPYGGRISVENRDGEYKVSTTVVIPIKS